MTPPIKKGGQAFIPHVWDERNKNYPAWSGLSTDTFLDIALGRIPGAEIFYTFGFNPGVKAIDTFENTWDQGGRYIYLESDTQLFASSSSASDVGNILIVVGLDDNYLEVTRLVTLNGQTQVAVSDLMFRIHFVQLISGSGLLGDVYVAESNTLTGGVPDTDTKIKAKVRQGVNITSMDNFTVPASRSIYVDLFLPTVGKDGDVRVRLSQRNVGFDFFFTYFEFDYYQTSTPATRITPVTITEKIDTETLYSSSNIGTSFSAVNGFLIIDN